MRASERRRRQRIERLALGVVLLGLLVGIGTLADDPATTLILSVGLLVWVAVEWLLWSLLLRTRDAPRPADRTP